MKTILFTTILLASTAAQAQLLVSKGTQAVLQVNYEFHSDGGFASPSKDQKGDWAIDRKVSITAHYAADAPQPFGAMHASDPKQKSDINALEAQAKKSMAQQAPMMGDMMAIAQSCGMMNPNMTPAQTKAAEACVEKKVNSYADNMAPPTDVAAQQAQITQMSQAGGPRFQLWQMKSMSGNWSTDESHHKQVYEMTCTETKVCRRETLITGGGALPMPPGGQSVAGASMVEVDSLNKDLVVQLPLPLGVMKLKQTVTTTIPGEKSAVTETVSKPWMLPLNKPMTARIPADLRGVSGRQEIQIPGERGEGGVLRVTWTFSRQ